MQESDSASAQIQLIDYTRTGHSFNAYLVLPHAIIPCSWGQQADMTRAEAIRLARQHGYEPTVRHIHQVWLQQTTTSVARQGYEAHDAGQSLEDSPWAVTSPHDVAWRIGWHMAARGYAIPSLHDPGAIRMGRGVVHVRDQQWKLAYDGAISTVTRIS